MESIQSSVANSYIVLLSMTTSTALSTALVGLIIGKIFEVFFYKKVPERCGFLTTVATDYKATANYLWQLRVSYDSTPYSRIHNQWKIRKVELSFAMISILTIIVSSAAVQVFLSSGYERHIMIGRVRGISDNFNLAFYLQSDYTGSPRENNTIQNHVQFVNPPIVPGLLMCMAARVVVATTLEGIYMVQESQWCSDGNVTSTLLLNNVIVAGGTYGNHTNRVRGCSEILDSIGISSQTSKDAPYLTYTVPDQIKPYSKVNGIKDMTYGEAQRLGYISDCIMGNSFRVYQANSPVAIYSYTLLSTLVIIAIVSVLAAKQMARRWSTGLFFFSDGLEKQFLVNMATTDGNCAIHPATTSKEYRYAVSRTGRKTAHYGPVLKGSYTENYELMESYDSDVDIRGIESDYDRLRRKWKPPADATYVKQTTSVRPQSWATEAGLNDESRRHDEDRQKQHVLGSGQSFSSQMSYTLPAWARGVRIESHKPTIQTKTAKQKFIV